MNFTAFDAIIFDCDGVLVDTETLANMTWQDKLAEHGLFLSLQELHHYFTGYTTELNLAKATELLGRPLPTDFIDQIRELFWQKISLDLPLIPYVEDALNQIQLPKATATNAKREELNFKLERSGLDRFFSHRLCVEDVSNPKPAPDIYQLAATKLGSSPQNCAVVEDSIAGIKAGVAAGMTVFGYCKDTPHDKQKEAGAFKCFDDMRELPDLITQAAM